MGSRRIDLTGQRFARLVALHPVGPNSQGNLLWECQCDCGNVTVTTGIYLRKGHTKTCGCQRVEERPSDGLTQDYVQSVLDYDANSGIFRWKSKRRGQETGSVAGKQSHGYLHICLGKPYPAHRLAWLYVYGSWPNEQVDHINRQRADNRISNLRLATPQLNNRNSSIQSNNTSGYKGVSWYVPLGKWSAYITISRKKMHLGYFSKVEDAARAYDAAAAKYFGEFVCPNFKEAA